MPVTLKEIAHKTGFSISTISHALTGRPAGKSRLSPDTIALVTKTAKELGYRPNTLARSLKNSRTNTIGIIVPNIRGDFYEAILEGIYSEVFPEFIPLVTIHQYNSQTERKMLETLLEKRVDGIIAAYSGRWEIIQFYQQIAKEQIPLILVDRGIEGLKLPLVRSDHYKAVYNASLELQKLGHKKITYIRVSATHMESTRLYEQGYRDAMSHAGLSANANVLAYTDYSDWTRTGLSHLASRIIGQLADSTAVIVNSDMLCYELIPQLENIGKLPGRDISVIGTGDYYPSALYGIELSSISVDNFAIGKKAAQLVLQSVKNNTSPAEELLELLPCSVELRKTTGPAPTV